MAGVMGINIKALFTLIFALGAALAGLAGIMAGRCSRSASTWATVSWCLTLGRHCHWRHRLCAGRADRRSLVGFIDTWARMLLPSALGDIGIYLLMAGVLYLKPRGLFPATT